MLPRGSARDSRPAAELGRQTSTRLPAAVAAATFARDFRHRARLTVVDSIWNSSRVYSSNESRGAIVC